MKRASRLPLAILAGLSAIAFCTAETTGPAAPPPVKPWPLEDVEIPASPRVLRGQLENGLRYAIIAHASPPGRISMRLVVMAGSLDENDDERGYAHFVEHMAFNGTTHFPAGELVKFLQRQGAQFGPHVNATTSPNETIYKLELPDNSIETLRTGLRIFRDFSDGLLFQPREVKRERGVILSEERSRHNAGETKRLALVTLLYNGTRIPDRQPIGRIAVIEKATAAGLRKFYDAWYRPENLGVAIAGEIDPAEAEKLLREVFTSLAARGAPRETPAIGALERPTQPTVAIQAESVSGFNISLTKMGPAVVRPVTWGQQLNGLRLHAALAMLRARLQHLTEGVDNTISGSFVSADVEYHTFRKLSVGVSSSPNAWEKSMAIVEQEVRRARDAGFDANELAYVQSELREQARAAARMVPTFLSTDVSDGLVNSMEEDLPFALADETLDQTLSMIDQLTTADCQQAFRQYWGEQPPYIFITTAPQFIPGISKVQDVYAESSRLPVTSERSEASVIFGYQDFGPAGTVVEKTHVEDLDLWLVRFANGVRLNLKRTHFENNLVRFNVRVGTGGLGEPKDKPGLRLWALAWLIGGVGKHPVGDFSRILNGAGSLDTSTTDDAFLLEGSAQTENLPLTLREITAYVSDPAFRPEGFRQTAAALHGQMDPLWNSSQGPVQRFILPSLGGGDSRLGLPDPTLTFARTYDELRAWLAPQLASGPVEISLVGDFDVDKAIASVAGTLGALPSRQAKPPLDAERKLHFPSKPVSTRYYYSGPADRPSTLEFFWPVHDPLSSADLCRLPMLALILRERVNDQVREKKGATYSPSATFGRNESYPGSAFLRCTLEVSPHDALKYSGDVRRLANKLARNGVTADELARAKAEYSAAMKGWKTDNNFWLNGVLRDAQEHPARLTDARSASAEIETTSAADLNTLARKYLGADRVFRYIIDPTARMPKKK